MIIGNPITVGGEGSGGASGYTFEDGVLHIWGVRGSHLLDTKTITEGGTYAASDEGLEGYSVVDVNMELRLERLAVSMNGTYLPSEGKDGFSQVVVNNPADGRCQHDTPIGWCSMPDLLSELFWECSIN